jgi:hypothetical protein
VLTFLFTALLPVQLRQRRGDATSIKAFNKPDLSLVSCAVKAAVSAVILRLYQFNSRLNLYVRHVGAATLQPLFFFL